jgi:hypothetical protein
MSSMPVTTGISLFPWLALVALGSAFLLGCATGYLLRSRRSIKRRRAVLQKSVEPHCSFVLEDPSPPRIPPLRAARDGRQELRPQLVRHASSDPSRDRPVISQASLSDHSDGQR